MPIVTASDAKLAACAALWGLSMAVVGFGAFMAGRSSVERLVPEVTKPLPAREQADGSLVLERDPDPAREPAPHAIPAGHVEERRISVHVQPDVIRKSDTTNTDVSVTPACECKPVRVDLSLVRDTDGGRRVIASSPDGRILGGLDVPIAADSIFRNREWAAGVSYNPFDGTPGAWIERDVGRIRVGADLYQERNALASGLAIRLRVGWTF